MSPDPNGMWLWSAANERHGEGWGLGAGEGHLLPAVGEAPPSLSGWEPESKVPTLWLEGLLFPKGKEGSREPSPFDGTVPVGGQTASEMKGPGQSGMTLHVFKLSHQKFFSSAFLFPGKKKKNSPL